MLSLLSSTNVMGPNIKLAPAATAMVLCPVRSCCTARCTATNDELHAVSMVIYINQHLPITGTVGAKEMTLTLGPCQSKKYDTRFDATLTATPVAE